MSVTDPNNKLAVFAEEAMDEIDGLECVLGSYSAAENPTVFVAMLEDRSIRITFEDVVKNDQA